MSFLDDPKFIEASKAFVEASDAYQKEADEFYAALPHDDRLKIFCAVMKLLAKGELEDKGSYRHVLYDTFQFGPESYAPAQCAGYLQLHNSIYNYDDLHHMIEKFVTEHMDITKDDLKSQITDYLVKKLYF
jgi:hypothetical protein